VHLGQVGPVSVDPRAPLPTFGIPGIRVNLGRAENIPTPIDVSTIARPIQNVE